MIYEGCWLVTFVRQSESAVFETLASELDLATALMVRRQLDYCTIGYPTAIVWATQITRAEFDDWPGKKIHGWEAVTEAHE